MVSLVSLWIPILVSAVAVFMASSVIHMVLKYHAGDWRKLPAEDGVMEALRKFSIPPGEYMMPRCDSMAAMKEPAYVEKWNKGPVALLTVVAPGPMSMNKSLTMWFVYCVIVSAFAAYVAGRALAPGAQYLEAFRFAGFTAFACYAVGSWQGTIWYHRAWSTTAKLTLDGLIYAVLTGGIFGWLWPGM